MKTVKQIILWFFLFVFIILNAFGLSLANTITADAATMTTKYVASASDVPDPSSGKYVYLSNMTPSNMSYKIYNTGLMYKEDANDYDSLYADNTYHNVIMTKDKNVGKKTKTYTGTNGNPAYEIRYNNAGYTSDGQKVDLVIRVDNISVTWYHDYAASAVLFGMENGWNNVEEDNKWHIGVYSNLSASRMDVEIGIFHAGTDNSLNGYAYRFDATDIDVKDAMNGGSYTTDYVESVTLLEGFNNPVYLQNNSLVNVTTYTRNNETYTRYRATKTDSNTFASGISTYVDGTFKFMYTGSGCGITIASAAFAPGEPVADIDPTKTATAEASAGQAVQYEIEATIPYTLSETANGGAGNNYSQIKMTDTLPAQVASTSATVHVYRTDTLNTMTETDDTSNWTVSRSGQTITVQAKTTAGAGGNYRFVIDTSIRPSIDISSLPSGTLSNGSPAKRIDNKATLNIGTQTLTTNNASTLIPTATVSYKVVGDIPSSHSTFPSIHNGYIGEQYTAADQVSNYPTPEYTFTGWYTSDPTTDANAKKWVDGTKLTDKSMVLYGRFVHNTTQVEYRISGTAPSTHSELPATKTLFVGDPYNAEPALTNIQEGWTFDGWFTSDPNANASAVKWHDGDVLPAQKVILYGKFTHIPATVNYKLIGDTPSDASTPPASVNSFAAETYTVAGPMTTSVSTAWYFNGWYLDSNLTNKAGATIKLPAGTTTLYGSWEKASVTIDKTVANNMLASPSAGDIINYTIKISNNGDSVLHDVVLNDVMLGGDIYTADALSPGSNVVKTFPHKLTQSEIDSGTLTNTAEVTGLNPGNNKLTQQDSVTVSLGRTPSISLEKTANTSNISQATVGSTIISYHFVITNTGNTTLTSTSLKDALISANSITLDKTSLAPGEKAEVDAAYTIKQSDIDNGSVTNSATVTATSPTGNVTDSDQVTTTITRHPSIDIEKTGRAISTTPHAGDQAIFDITVRNNGDTTLNNVSLSDTLKGAVIDNTKCKDTLSPGESYTTTATYNLVQSDIDNGVLNNTCNVSSNDPSGKKLTDTDDASITLNREPSIALVKTASANMISDPSANKTTINYTFDISNTGNITITDLEISDPLVGNNIALKKTSLLPGESTQATASYTVTQDDIESGNVHNTATVTGNTTVGGQQSSDETDTQLQRNPSIAFTKTAVKNQIEHPDAGDKVDFVIRIENTGNTIINIDELTDPLISSNEIEFPKSSLNPGESSEKTVQYSLKQSDIDSGEITNTANVAVSASGNWNDTKTAEATVEMITTESLSFDKSSDRTNIAAAKPGDQIEYTFTITNNGDVTLHGFQLTDEKLGGDLSEILGIADKSLAPNEKIKVSTTYNITQADIDAGNVHNTAQVASGTANGDDEVDVSIERIPGISLTKEVVGDVIIPNSYAGDIVTFSLDIINTGNVTLTNVNLRDGMEGVDIDATGMKTTLAPAEETHATATYILKQSDIDAGEVGSIAYVNGDAPEGTQQKTVDDDDDAGVELPPNSSVSIDKTVTPDTIEDPLPGDIVEYTITVTNNGNTTLHNTVINDELLDGDITSKFIRKDNNAYDNGDIAPGDSITAKIEHAITQEDINRGYLINNADVSSLDPYETTITSEASAILSLSQQPSIIIDKTISNEQEIKDKTPTNTGDEINYTITITNTGNTTLKNIALTDEMFGGDIPLVDNAIKGINNEAISLITSDIRDNQDQNGDSDQDQTKSTMPMQQNNDNNDDVADNEGQQDDANIDDSARPYISMHNSVNEADEITTLQPGEYLTISLNHEITQDDIDKGLVTNTAYVKASAPANQQNDTQNDNVEAIYDQELEANDTAEIALNRVPQIDITDIAEAESPLQARVNDKVKFNITITNTGNTTLENLVLDDEPSTAEIDTANLNDKPLAPGESITLEAFNILSEEEFVKGVTENEATITASPVNAANDETVSDTDSDQVEIVKYNDVADILSIGNLPKTGNSIVILISLVLFLTIGSSIIASRIARRK